MPQKNTPIIVGGLFFAAIALIHLGRLLHPFSIIIGTFSVPVWVSGILFILCGLISAWLFRSLEPL